MAPLIERQAQFRPISLVMRRVNKASDNIEINVELTR